VTSPALSNRLLIHGESYSTFCHFRIAVINDLSMIFKATKRLSREQRGLQVRLSRLLIQLFLDAKEDRRGSVDAFPLRNFAANPNDI
jgi:hypothetical protein